MILKVGPVLILFLFWVHSWVFVVPGSDLADSRWGGPAGSQVLGNGYSLQYIIYYMFGANVFSLCFIGQADPVTKYIF